MMSDTDVVVVGSGAGGLTAALAAAVHGQRVTVIEVDKQFGGTSAISGGGVWLPNTSLQAEAGIHDSRDDLERYLQRLAGPRVDSALLNAYLDGAAALVEFYKENTGFAMFADVERPDYQSTLDGAAPFGRLVGVGLFDSTKVSPDQLSMQKPSPWPGGVEPILWHEAREYIEKGDPWGWIPLAHERVKKGLLARGAALVAGLIDACLKNGVEFVAETRGLRLTQAEDGSVNGIEVEHDGETRTISVSAGVVIASGGFEWNEHLMKELVGLPMAEPLGPRTNVGDGLKMGMAVGAQTALLNAMWWTAGGGQKPGGIAVNKSGRRFVDECLNYHDYGQVLTQFDAATHTFLNYPAYAITDAPPTFSPELVLNDATDEGDPFEKHLAEGRIIKADTLEELAQKLGIDAEALVDEVAEFNRHAAVGEDPKFHRGESPYDRWRKFDTSLPNPALRPLGEGPYYAEQIHARCFGTKGGLLVDEHAQVVHAFGNPIPGLYACGNAAASVFGVGYPGGGGTLGQAVVMGFLAGTHVGATSRAAVPA
jgi:3-oxosteroid 1-dehydrogenase